MNDGNIKPFEFTSEQSREEAAKNGRLGGIRSGERRREKALLRELMRDRLGDEIVSEKIKDELRKKGLNVDRVTEADLVVESTLRKAQNGDMQAVKLIFEMTEDKSVNIKIEDTKPKPAIVIDDFEGEEEGE